MKRFLALILTCALMLSAAPYAMAEDYAALYAGIDLSEPAEITWYHVGNELTDWDKVTAIANERLKEKINTTINWVHVSFADFIANYGLYLTSSDIDVIYTATFCNFGDNARAGAFKEITPEFIERYMPQLNANMAAEAWNEIKINGKIYTVPRNNYTVNVPAIVLTRQSLLDKYGFTADQFKTWDDLDTYLYAIADGEKGTGVYGLNSQGFWPSHMYFMNSRYRLQNASDGSGSGVWYLWDTTNETFNMDDLQWFGDTQAFRQWALAMAEYYKRGVYPSDVIANESTLDDTFDAGTSAVNFAEPEKAARLMASDADIVPLFCTMDETSKIFRGAYMRYGAAFPINSTKTERAAVAVDMAMNDPEINRLLVYGVEGDHYILNDDGTYSQGPNVNAFPADTMVFMLNNPRNPLLRIDIESVAAWRDQAYAQMTSEFPSAGFTYDGSKYSAEIAVMTSIWNQYQWSLCFGLYGDATEAIIDQFIAEMKAAGIEKIGEDFKQQLAAYMGL